jgi:CheY-like chemotaxis protein
MEYTAPGLETVTHQLSGLDRPKKAKMLVVDDEPDNLDLLYRTFRRDFNVLKAESGVQALEILKAEGEVAVIISDQRMPEMKGTEFLSQTVPEFPDTVRIILTGFTDVEDLVEAINSGQVYKYITKPWDPEELKAVVSRAAETYVLLKQRTEELYRAQKQTALLARLVQIAQDVCELKGSLSETAKAFATTFNADRAALQIVAQGKLTEGGLYNSEAAWLEQDPLVQQALASGQMQASLDLAKDEALANLPHYAQAGIQAHLVIPIALHHQVMAMLSLQWEQTPQIHEEEIVLLHLAAQQVGVSIAYTRNQTLVTA